METDTVQADGRPPRGRSAAARARTGRRAQALRGDLFLLLCTATPFLLAAGFYLADMKGTEAMMVLSVLTLAMALLAFVRAHAVLGRRAELGYVIMTTAMIYWFYLPGVLVAFREQQWRVRAAEVAITNEQALVAFVQVGIFYFTFGLVYHLLPIGARGGLRVGRLLGDGAPPGPESQRRLVRFVIAATLLFLGFFLVASGGFSVAIDNIMGSRSAETPWDADGNFGTALTPVYYIISSLGSVGATAGLYLTMLGDLKRRTRFWLVPVSLLVVVIIAVESGTRSSLLMVFMPAVALVYRESLARRGVGRVGRRFLVFALILLLFATAGFQRMYRYQRAQSENLSTMDLAIGEADYLTMTAYAVSIGDREPELTYESPALHILTGPIPRVLWPDKPYLKSIVVFSSYVWGVDITSAGGNTLPSIVGQYFLAWGWFGVAEIGFWLGLFIRLGDAFFVTRRRGSHARLPYAILLLYFFVSFRQIGFNYFFPIPLAVLAAHYVGWGRRSARAPAAVPFAGGTPATPRAG